jgi:hypothetical protein
MLNVSCRRRWFACAVALALLPALVSAVPVDTVKDKPAPGAPSPTEKVRNDLDQTVTFTDKFKPDQEVTLGDVLDVLHKEMKLNFVIDEKAFAAQGATNVPATVGRLPDLKDLKAKDLLRAFLAKVVVAPGAADYVVVGDKVIITVDEAVKYRWMQQPVSFNCDKEELPSALKRLAHETGTTLVIDPRAAKETQPLVTLHAQDVTLETVVVLLAQMAGLKPVRVGNSLFLTTKENAAEMRADQDRASLIGPCPLPAEYPSTPAGM